MKIGSYVRINKKTRHPLKDMLEGQVGVVFSIESLNGGSLVGVSFGKKKVQPYPTNYYIVDYFIPFKIILAKLYRKIFKK